MLGLRRRRHPANGEEQHRGGLRLADLIGLGGILIVTILALFPYAFMPFDAQLRVGPSLSPPSATHFFGTDDIGRDLYSRVILGVQFTWLPAIAIIASASVFGSAIGLIAGLVGGWIDELLQRIIDVFFMVPSMLFAMAFAAILGPGTDHSVVAIAICWWPWYAWIARDELVRIKGSPHFQAALVAGTSRPRQILRYGLPGVIPSLITAAGLDVANVVTTLSLMSFLGLGQPDPAPELGALVSRSLDSLTMFWWLPILPATVIFFICFIANLFGDAVRTNMRGR